MATHEQRQEKLSEAQSQLKAMDAVDENSLDRTSELSPDINFAQAVPYFAEMLDICRQLNQRDLSRLPSTQLDGITRACTTLNSHVKKIRDFDLNQNTPGDVCKATIKQIKDGYDAIMDPLLLPLAFTATQATDYSKIEREAKGHFATIEAESKKIKKFIEQAKIDAESALAAVKEQAAEAGVSSNAQIFIKDAEAHAELANKWMKATIGTAALTLIVAVIALIVALNYHPATTAAAIQYIVAKLVVLSTLSFGIFWCARNYKSQKHNETLNKHRANALMTFRAFVEGTSDDRVKDAILLQASQAAFSGRPTGFDSREKENQTINPVVEILGKTIPKSIDT